jgi:hypothetical protein
MDPDPDPGGPKTRGSGGSGSATLVCTRTISFIGTAYRTGRKCHIPQGWWAKACLTLGLNKLLALPPVLRKNNRIWKIFNFSAPESQKKTGSRRKTPYITKAKIMSDII